MKRKRLTIPVSNWLEANAVEEFRNDHNLVSWLLNCEYLEEVQESLANEIDQGILTSDKHKSELKFINYLLTR